MGKTHKNLSRPCTGDISPQNQSISLSVCVCVCVYVYIYIHMKVT